ncbi:MAG: zinc ABC transporter substrate-binding protein [Gammaproteobacteria bacterium]|nr:MAG: zinc ABC transporter substrate-binding protein [Gammaproteobacteria bacterium]
MNRCRPLPWLMSVALLACSQPPEPPAEAPPADSRPLIAAVNYPLAWMAERIGGDAIRVALPLPPTIDPAEWQPDPQALEVYRQAELVLLNGAGYAPWVRHAGLPNNRLIDTTRHVRDRLIREDEDPLAPPGSPAEAAVHGDWATMTWLDPTLAIAQATEIRDALLIYLPEQEGAIRARYAVLLHELESLDQSLERAFAPLAAEPLLFSRPIYQYLARRYRLQGRALNWRPDVYPGEAGFDELRALRAEFPARLMVWEDYLLQVTVDRLEAEGVRSLVYRPAANRPPDGDFLAVMRDNLGNVARFAAEFSAEARAAAEAEAPQTGPGDAAEATATGALPAEAATDGGAGSADAAEPRQATGSPAGAP